MSLHISKAVLGDNVACHMELEIWNLQTVESLLVA